MPPDLPNNGQTCPDCTVNVDVELAIRQNKRCVLIKPMNVHHVAVVLSNCRPEIDEVPRCPAGYPHFENCDIAPPPSSSTSEVLESQRHSSNHPPCIHCNTVFSAACTPRSSPSIALSR